MLGKNKILKEASCKPLTTIISAALEKNVDPHILLEGVPYDLSHLLNKHERVEWWVWCKIIENLRPYFTYTDYEHLGGEYQKKEHYIEGYIFATLFFSSGNISKFFRGSLSKAEDKILDPLFSCFNKEFKVIENNKVRTSIFLKPGYQHCHEWFYMSKGVWEEIGNSVGMKDLKIDLSILPNGGTYLVSWHSDNIFTGLKKQINWFFNIRKAFADLTESHEELSVNYHKLEESKKLLQRQKTQLTIAYNITMSIRKSHDLHKTLDTIIEALVNDADLSFAMLKLDKDAEGNIIDIEAEKGNPESYNNQMLYPIIIEKEKIGELIIYPKDDADISGLDELMQYLLPLINISIYDSLALRTITDYKNNLESKVDERTAELRLAKEKLSGIIELQKHFFTNISHEFRTPLTLIMGPSKIILEQTHNDIVRENADLIYDNARKLTKLANQLLDLSKIEAGSMKLEAGRQNIIAVIKRILDSFKSFAEKKNIALTFSTDCEELIMFFDEDKVDKIISNLLSNALKFTPYGGRVNVEVNIKLTDIERETKKYLEIAVSDNGIGISDENLGKIFDRFYQVDNRMSKEYEGTGVGLSLTKELVEIHKGIINVSSKEGKGSSFSVLLPMGKAHLRDSEIVENIQIKHSIISEKEPAPVYNRREESINNKTDLLVTNENNKPLLLIVEDNAGVRKYIIEILQQQYQTAEAVDGEDGLNKAFDLIPDLIISDIMMPKIDGINFCHSLKNDPRTSHIPLVLLTAKATLGDKIEGLESGADDYIMKPFEPEELLVRMRNLIEQRKRIHRHFQQYEIVLDKTYLTSIDQKFLKNVFDIISQNISDENFSVEILSGKLAISRSLLHKKLTALTGQSPNELIKRLRLNKAAKLIEHRSDNISEIALQVGFSNPSYFAECFFKQFGIKPSRYHNNTVDGQ